MDIFHDSPLFAGVRQMLGGFATKMMRPIAMKHDQEESMPWDLMKQAHGLGLTQTSIVDSRKKLTGPEEVADGCAGICLAIGGSGLAASPVARMGTEEQKAEFRKLLNGPDEKGHI